jgi:hypothetical protein
MALVVKMVTVLEDCTTEEQRSVMPFLSWAKGLNEEDIYKEMFPVHGRKCLSRKAVLIWVQKSGRRVADDEEVETTVRKLLRQHSKDFHAAGFDELVKRWNKCIDVGGGYVEKYMFSPLKVRISHVSRFISICDLLTQSPSHTYQVS